MNDSITFAGSTELDNGWTVSTSFLLDNSDGVAASIFDARSLTINMNDMGTLSFEGDDAAGAMGAVDDVMPTASGDETWDVLGAADTKGAVLEVGALGSANSNNMMKYSNTTVVDGLSISASYTPSGTGEAESSIDGVTHYTGYDNLTVGYAIGEDNAVAGTGNFDVDTMYVTYVYDSVKVGYQKSTKDGNNATNSDDFMAYGITYTLTPDISIGYGYSETDLGSSTVDQETSNVSFSYTMGGMTISGKMISADNTGHSTVAVNDRKGYSIGLAFAF